MVFQGSFMVFGWFQWFLVGLNGFSRYFHGFYMVSHGFWLVSMVFQVGFMVLSCFLVGVHSFAG